MTSIYLRLAVLPRKSRGDLEDVSRRGILGFPGYNGGRMNPPEGTADLPDIKDIAGPETLPDIWELLVVAGMVVVGLLLATALAIFIFRRLSRKATRAQSPFQIARRRLDDLERQIAELTPNVFSVAVSDTLKDYLSQRYGDAVRYETSEEFLQRLSQARANALPLSTREDVASFLTVADEIKYGRPPDAEAGKVPLLDQARLIIRGEIAPAPRPSPAPPHRKTAP
jgi:hypothetical protein